ncbi:MAG: transglycosylase SLT domain-containing protein [bacterium]
MNRSGRRTARLTGTALLGAILLLAPAARAQSGDPIRDAEREADRLLQEVEREFDRAAAELDRDWRELVRRQNEEWERLQREVEAKWREYIPSTRVRWVDHSASRESRSRVDFEAGEITLEALADGEKSPEEAAREIEGKIRRRLLAILAERAGEPSPLRDQIADRTGSPVTSVTANRYIDREVLPRVRIDPRPTWSRDRKRRYGARVRISLISRHLERRAKRYLDLVRSMADRFGVAPSRVMAIMHTESAFNPKAVSPVPAYGLMQLVPRTGALDAYAAVHGRRRILPPAYLYDPRNNVELGAAYFSLIKRDYLKSVRREPHNTYLAIASYNWGIGNIRRVFLRGRGIRGLDGGRLLERILRGAPRETHDYLRRINRREPLYRSLF